MPVKNMADKKKKFFTKDEKSLIYDMFEKKYDKIYIAKCFNTSVRHISDIIESYVRGYRKEFTPEEYQILLEETYKRELSDGKIAKLIGTKSYINVRNEKRKEKFKKDLENYRKNIEKLESMQEEYIYSVK